MLRSILIALGIIVLSGAATLAYSPCDDRCMDKYCKHGVISRTGCFSRCTIACAQMRER
jgi:hypothetical protein